MKIAYIPATIFIAIFIFGGVPLSAHVSEEGEHGHTTLSTDTKVRTNTTLRTNEIRTESKSENGLSQAKTETTENKRKADVQVEMRANKQALDARITAKRTLLKDKQEEIAVRLEAQRETRVRASIERIFSRFENHVSRLKNIQERIESRIAKLQEEGHDLTKSLDVLATAEAQLTLTAEDMAEMKTVLTAEIEVETTMEEVRAVVQTLKESIGESRQALLEVVRSISGEISTEGGAELEVSARAN